MFLHFISKWCFALINLVRENFSPNVVALSLVLGMYFGFTPALTLQWFVLAIASLLIPTNFPIVLASSFLFSALGNLATPFFNWVGLGVLTQTPWLLPLWSWMYHAPVIPYTQFNQTLVMGSTLVIAVISLPAYLGFKAFFTRYAEKIDVTLTSSRFYRSISHYERIYG